jgi:hypothetical protein
MMDKRKSIEYAEDPKSHWVAHPVTAYQGNPQFTHVIFCPGCECGHGWTAGWQFNGNLYKPTVSPSLKFTETRGVCHSFITDGNIQFLGDCWHALKGTTVALEPF